MFRARSQKRQAGRPKDARYYRLRLEPLEDRRLLSVFTVNSPADHAELLVEIIGGSASPLRSTSADGLVDVAYGQSGSGPGGQRVIDADAALGGDESEGTVWHAHADDPGGDGVLAAVGDPVPNDYAWAEAEPEKLTLRQAIQKANKNPGLDEIRFDFDKSEYGDGPYVIKPVYALPAITDPVVINGFTPGLGASPNTNLFHQGKNTVIQVWLEGSLAGKGTNGLVFEVPDAGVRSEVRGLAISGFQPTGDCNVVTEGFGIVLGGAGNVAVEDCFLGIAPDGYLPMVNASGIGVLSPKNVIQDNLIGANLYNGIQVGGRKAGTPVAGVILNVLWDNYIGTTRDGDFPMGNDNGIRVTEGASQTVIGGADHGNLLSGNRYQGVLIDKTAGGNNTIAGNLIGTDKTGMTTDPDKTPESGDELGNGDDGIDVGGPGSTSTVNVIGGTDPADRNVIAGNGGAGVLIVGAQVNNTQVKGNLIGTDITGTKKLGNAGPGVELQNSPDNTVQSNVSSGNGGVGVVIFGADAKRNVVRANRLGTSLDGKTALGNLAGVAIWHGSDNVIADNVMSGNTIHGAYVEGESARNNLFTGNKIGTNLAGNAALSNVCDGIRIQGAPDNIIGGAALADHNIISGNKHAGLHIEGAKAKNTSVQGNYIGTDVLGTSPVPNGVGVRIVDAPQNAIGGTAANFGDRPRNVISGNQDAGIVIQGAGAKGNWIQGNYIGTDKDGAGTNMGNRGDGILIDGAPENVVGGETTTPGKTPGNIISANWDAGVHIKGAGAKKNRVQGNVIGLDKSGNKLGNIEQGVFIEDAPDSEIGDKTKGITGPASFSKKHNVISGNVGEGVRIEGNGAVGNCVRRNKIYRNDGLEINLDGNEDLRLADDDVTPNDWKDGDTGPNHLMNFPVGLTAWDSGTQTTISGILSTADPENAEVDVYVGKTRDATGFGEGELYKGTVKPDESGWFSLIVPGFSLSYPWLLFSAVATDTTTCSTSEFSPVYGINPTTWEVDSDGDGFPDEWETGGIDFNGDAVVDLPLDTGAEPANPNQKDIFLEIDYMESPSRTLRPDAGFELLMYTAFATAPGGIVLHVEVDEPVPYSGAILWDTTHPGPANDFNDYKLGNPVNPTGTGPNDGHFGSPTDRGLRDANGTDAPAGYRIGAKSLVYHYCLLVHDLWKKDGSGALVDMKAGGIAEPFGNDFVAVTGEHWATKTPGPPTVTGALMNEVAVCMHELGHNLGLGHGGPWPRSTWTDWDSLTIQANTNYKPNYLSIMNYTFQWTNRVPTRPLDFSRWKLPTLYEAFLDETLGLHAANPDLATLWPRTAYTVHDNWKDFHAKPTVGPIDWNDDGHLETIEQAGINDYWSGTVPTPTPPIPKNDVLVGAEDWSQLFYNFRVSPYAARGAHTTMPSAEPEMPIEQVLEDAKHIDFDGDGLSNYDDNVPFVYNPDQTDSDGDGIGDAGELADFSFDLPSVPGGEPVNAIVRLLLAAPPDGATICFYSSDTTVADLPIRVTIPAGERVARVPVATSSLLQENASVTIYAVYGDDFLSSELTVGPPAPHVDLEVSQVTSPDPALAGAAMVYTLTVENRGPGDVTGVTLTDVLPAGASLVDVTCSQGTYTATDDSATVLLGGLAAGAQATATVTVRPLAVGDLTNEVTVTSDGIEDDPADNTSVLVATVVPCRRSWSTRPTTTPTASTTRPTSAFARRSSWPTRARGWTRSTSTSPGRDRTRSSRLRRCR